MRYREPEDEYEYQQQQQLPVAGIPYDTKVAGLRWSNEIEPRKGVIDEEFLKRNRLLVIDSSKLLPLGNIRDKKTVKLLRLRRTNSIMEKEAGLIPLAEETIMANIADIQTSRAQGGFNARLEVTQRREWVEKSQFQKKKSLFGRMFKAKEQSEEVDRMMEVEE